MLEGFEEHHIQKGEGEMFKKARKTLSSDQAEEIGRHMAQEKTALMGEL